MFQTEGGWPKQPDLEAESPLSHHKGSLLWRGKKSTSLELDCIQNDLWVPFLHQTCLRCCSCALYFFIHPDNIYYHPKKTGDSGSCNLKYPNLGTCILKHSFILPIQFSLESKVILERQWEVTPKLKWFLYSWVTFHMVSEVGLADEIKKKTNKKNPITSEPHSVQVLPSSHPSPIILSFAGKYSQWRRKRLISSKEELLLP